MIADLSFFGEEGPTTFRALIDAQAANISSEIGLFDYIVGKYLLLQIKLVNKWKLSVLEAAKYQIPIAYSFNQDHAINNEYRKVGVDGKKDYMSSAFLPEDIHLYIAESENHKLVSKNSKIANSITSSSDCGSSIKPVYTTSKHFIFNTLDVYNHHNCASMKKLEQYGFAKSQPSECINSFRSLTNRRDRLRLFRFSSRDEIDAAFNEEGAFNNQLEMMCTIVISPPNGGAPITILRPRRGLRKRDLRQKRLFGRYIIKDVVMDTELIEWIPADHGCTWTYQWTEEDGGGTTTSTIPIVLSTLDPNNPGMFINSTATFQQVRQFNDDEMGNSFVDYCDRTSGGGQRYNTGPIDFDVTVVPL